jgi:hypothetical protein
MAMLSTTLNTVPERSYTRIATNPCYDLAYDSSKNRIYFKIHGYWKNAEVVPDLLTDWDKALAFTHSDFTVLVDMRQMITHPQGLNKLHTAVQQKVASSGVAKVANIMPTDKIASLQAAEITTCTKLLGKKFTSLPESEDWLDYSTLKQ